MAESKSSFKPDPVKNKSILGGPSYIKDDLPLIRQALIVLVVSLALSAAIVGVSKALLVTQLDEVSHARTLLGDALNKRQQAEKDRQEIHDYQAKYTQLRELGLVGEEKRLDWIEQVKYIRESRKLLPIDYEMSAQQVFQIAPAVSMGDLELRGSKVQVKMGLLHELDLFNFLSDLQRKGFYPARECTVKRIGEGVGNAQLPRLAAECTLYWLTLGERSGAQSQTPLPGNR